MKNQPPKPPAKISMPLEVAENREAKNEWVRVRLALGDKFDARDINLLMDYCLTHAEILTLRIKVEEEGDVIESTKGGLYMNPRLSVMMQKQGHLAALRRDLYFTPKSRIEKQTRGALTKSKTIKDSVREDDDNGQD